MRIAFILFLICTAASSHAQISIPFGFTSEEKNKLIREDDSLKYYTATRDSTKMVAINDEMSWYKLMNKDKSVVAEGGYIVDDDKYYQDGRAMSRYPNGTIKLSGYYRHGKPVGLWQGYYSGGQLKTIYNFGIVLDDAGFSSCYSGAYQEFYENGKLKINGFYGARLTEVFDTVDVEDPVSGNTIHKTVGHNSYAAQKTGHWEYFSPEGELSKKEDF
jgi:antitoxin component YwqK of YwqJK toxin-antitoxin module